MKEINKLAANDLQEFKWKVKKMTVKVIISQKKKRKKQWNTTNTN